MKGWDDVHSVELRGLVERCALSGLAELAGFAADFPALPCPYFLPCAHFHHSRPTRSANHGGPQSSSSVHVPDPPRAALRSSWEKRVKWDVLGSTDLIRMMRAYESSSFANKLIVCTRLDRGG